MSNVSTSGGELRRMRDFQEEVITGLFLFFFLVWSRLACFVL